MNRSTRLIALTGLLIALIVGVSYARPGWPTELGVDFWSVPSLNARLQREIHWRDELDALDDTVRWRIEVKDRIIDDVLAHRLSLVRAAVAFKALNRDWPQYAAVLRSTYPSRNDDECICRNVIGYVESATVRQPSRAMAEVARLEAELRRATDGNGMVQLPE